MEMRKLILIFLLLPLFSIAQELSFTSVEIQTFELYSDFNYKAVIKLGERALKEKIDYYDLRVRLGLSYFKLKKYEQAFPHLCKAIDMNPSDLQILGYTYSCLIFTAQFSRANALLVKYPQIDPNITPMKSGISSFEFEPGIITSQNSNDFKGSNLRKSGTNFAEGNFFSSMNYIRVYSDGLISPDLKWHVGANFFQSNHLSKLQFINQNVETDKSSLNYQLNFGLTQTFNHGWGAGFGIAYYKQNFPYIKLSDTDFPIPANTPIRDTSETYHSIAMSAFISKRLKFIEPVLFLNYGNFDLESRIQAELGITTFPLENAKFYTYSSVSYINQNSENGYAFNQKLGYSILPSINLEGSFLTGSLDNYMGSMGFLTLNTFDPVNWSAGLDVNLRYKKIQITPGYRYQKREGVYSFENTPANVSSKSYNYFNHLFFITLKCQF
jgi:hypothetical protein